MTWILIPTHSVLLSLLCKGTDQFLYPDRDMPIILQELQIAREHVAHEMHLFEDETISDKKKSSRLLFLFMKDLMDGINGRTSHIAFF
jgi:hypothetical protein